MIALSLNPDGLHVRRSGVRVTRIGGNGFVRCMSIRKIVRPVLAVGIGTHRTKDIRYVVKRRKDLLQRKSAVLIVRGPSLLHDVRSRHSS